MDKKALIQLVTGSRLCLATAAAVLTVWSGTERWALWCTLGLVVVMELTDIADGYLARRWNAVTGFGKMFDPFADSVSRLIVYWSLSTIGLCWAVVPLVLAARDITVAYLRIALSGAGRDVSARITGKIKAWVLGLGAIFLILGTLVQGPLSSRTIGITSALVIASVLVAGLHHLVVAWPLLRARMADPPS